MICVNHSRGATSASQIPVKTETNSARAHGRSLAFFSEGTFTRVPGLLPLHLGAFAVAVKAGVPVVPVAIRGSRALLRAGQWLPRRSPLTVTIGVPLANTVTGNA